MDSLMLITRPGGRLQIAEVMRVRVHTECEACREEARDKADARVSGESTSGTLISRDLGSASRDALFQSRLDSGAPNGLTKAEQDVVSKLSSRDQEVRRHEEAHARVGGEFAGRPSYTYQTGPDGKRYAIGGEVPIDVAPIAGDPEATIDKMEVVKRAALAPAEPSGADRRVAALADAQRLEAVAELNARRIDTQAGDAAPARMFAASVHALSRGPETEPGQRLARAA